MTTANPPPTDPAAELAEIAGGFIHEIKNHISTLALNLQLLAEDFGHASTPRERKIHDRIQRLQNECQRLTDLSNDFLRFARLRHIERRPVSLHDVLGEMVDFFAPTARSAGIDIKVFLPSDLPALLLDVDLFKQALLNLMLNAQQAMEEGGQLVVQAHCPEPNLVRLDLIDNGCGMSPETLARCFRPFHTTKPGGNGLGLPTTRRIVEMHGGRIEVQSERGKGTQFTIWLPIQSPAPADESPSSGTDAAVASPSHGADPLAESPSSGDKPVAASDG
ncbi:MAG: ATP-binding protein [Gemmataceae bacterium]|nr:ATP-binding protein [Gemmataceae bacterium]